MNWVGWVSLWLVLGALLISLFACVDGDPVRPEMCVQSDTLEYAELEVVVCPTIRTRVQR